MKSNKIYVVAAVFLLTGLVIMGISFAAGGFYPGRLKGNQYHAKTYATQSEITTLTVDDSNTGVELIPWDKEYIEVEYAESRRFTYTISEESETLLIRKNVSRGWHFFLFDFNFFSPTLKIRVPRNIKLRGELKTSNAAIKVSDLALDDMLIRSSNGAVELEDVKAVELDLKTSNAAIRLRDVHVEKQLTAVSNNNRLSVQDISAKEIRLKTSNGAIELEELQGEQIDVKTSNGRISVSEVAASRELQLITSNSAISGSLPGKMTDYSIESSTSNGSSTLPSRLKSGEISLVVKTSNARIDLEFED